MLIFYLTSFYVDFIILMINVLKVMLSRIIDNDKDKIKAPYLTDIDVKLLKRASYQFVNLWSKN